MSTWIIIGATSAMGEAFARKCATEGQAIVVTARKKLDAEAIAKDLKFRGASEAKGIALDITKPVQLAALDKLAAKTAGEINIGFFAGSMRDQTALNNAPEETPPTYIENLVGPAECLQRLAPLLETRGCGTIVALSSVAGDRGRASNYVYGSAKAGWTAFLSGLRNRLSASGVHVMTVKPGFVDTDMTWGLDGLFLVADPSDVADTLWKAAHKKRNSIYVPWFWWIIMTIIRHVPEPIFKKLKL